MSCGMGMLQLKDKFQNKGFNKYLNKVRAKKILEYATGTRCIELGCGEGQITKYLAKRYDYIIAVDEEKAYLNRVTRDAYRFHSKIEDLRIDHPVDYIVCSNLLEHVDNPKKIIKIIKQFGDRNSVFFFSVPNANSINRVLGKDIGMLSTTTTITVCDAEAGHKRMFTLETFINLFNKDFEIKDYGTFFYKIYHK